MWHGLPYCLEFRFCALAPFRAAGSVVAADNNPVKERLWKAVFRMLYGVAVEEVHHAVGNHVASIFDAFVLVEGSEDETYVVFVISVGYFFCLAVRCSGGPACEE